MSKKLIDFKNFEKGFRIDGNAFSNQHLATTNFLWRKPHNQRYFPLNAEIVIGSGGTRSLKVVK
jgi:hypothetical protein